MVAVGAAGEVWWLAPDLATRRQQTLPQPQVAAALDPYGGYLAVAGACMPNRISDVLGICRDELAKVSATGITIESRRTAP